MAADDGSLAERLLRDVQQSHAALIAHTDAVEAARQGLHAVAQALAAGLAGLSEEQVLATPSPEEWSMAEVMEHVAEHDRKYVEFERLGIDHYVEHGLEHAVQLWRLRATPAQAGDAASSEDATGAT